MTASPAEFIVFFVLTGGITALGFVASRWKRSDLSGLEEWGLAGRRLGTFLTWFLLGGDLYTAYTFVAVPGLVFGKGALGFFAVPYTVLVFPIAFFFIPVLWQVARNKGYVTAADFVKDRFQSKSLAVTVAITGILATIPYVALQIYGIEVSIGEMGIPVHLALTIAFVALAAFTYVSGLRAPVLIAVVKDLLIFITVILAVIIVPSHLGGFNHIFNSVPKKYVGLPPKFFSAYSSLAIGSALALFLYPHSINGSLGARSKDIVKRNMALLPIYSVVLGLIALLGYMAIAAHVHVPKAYGANAAAPALFQQMFPAPVAGMALAAISIGALVPASVMSIAAANLFSRNLWHDLLRPGSGRNQEATVAKIASLAVKFAALVFILAVPTKYVLYYQTAGGVWIVQTLPAVFLALFIKWLDKWATLLGMLVGLIWGTYLLAKVAFKTSFYSFNIFGHHSVLYIGIPTLVINVAIVLVGTLISRAARSGSALGALREEDFLEKLLAN